MDRSSSMSMSNGKRSKSKHDSPIQNLPIEILTTILSMLPIATIIDCKRVCKAWRDIVLDPLFAEAYDNHNPTTETEPNLYLLINPIPYSSKPPAFLYLAAAFDDPHHGYHLIASSKLISNPSRLTNHRSFKIVNSCLGFLYLLTLHNDDYEFYVYNPLTEQHFVLPPVTVNIHANHRIGMMGLGFAPLSNQYKAVTLTRTGDGANHLRVYTVGVDQAWRSLQIPIDLIHRNFHPYGQPAYLNGVLHWSMLTDSNHEEILCFDVDKETITAMALPKPLLEKYPHMIIQVVSIFNIHGVLGAGIAVRGTNKTSIWLMKEYAMIDTWAKYFTVKGHIDIGGSYPYFIEFRKNKDKVLLCEDHKLLFHLSSYNSNENTSTRLKIRGFDNEKTQATATVYVPSFFTIEYVDNTINS